MLGDTLRRLSIPNESRGEFLSALWLVIICLGAGALAARFHHPEGLAAGLNWWVLHVALPALVLQQILLLQWSHELLFPAVAMWLVFAGAWLLINLLGRSLGWTRGQIGALVLTAGLGNTSFVGYPLIEALRGTEALGVAVIADQMGSFLVLSSLGVIVAAVYAGQRVSAMDLLRRVAMFPAFFALLLALILRQTGGLPDVLMEVLGRLGQTLTPLALFTVGMQLRLRAVRHDLVPMLYGLGWKLLLAPLMIAGLAIAMGAQPATADIAVLQAAMAPMITAGILAQQHGLAPALANRIVGIGLLLSLLTVPLADYLLRL